jgi:hypothetical protein
MFRRPMFSRRPLLEVVTEGQEARALRLARQRALKPRMRPIRAAPFERELWRCTDGFALGVGLTQREAFDRWQAEASWFGQMHREERS